MVASTPNIFSYTTPSIQLEGVYTYAVELALYESVQDCTVVCYDADINYALNNAQQQTVQVITYNHTINFLTPYDVVATWALQANTVLNEGIFNLSDVHTLTDTLNHNAILQIWQQQKQALQQAYEGALLEAFITSFEKRIANKELLLQYVQKDVFRHHFFYPLYNQHFMHYKKQTNENIHFFDITYEKVMFLMEIQQEAELDENNLWHITKKITDNYNETALIPINAYECTYSFNANNSIQQIHGLFENFETKCTFIIKQKTKA
jgi:hypothetical protein